MEAGYGSLVRENGKRISSPGPNVAMLTTIEINSVEEFDQIRKTWHRLWTQTPRATFFQTPEWIEASWTHYPDPQKLRLILVERRGEIVGIVPFCVRTVRRK